MKGEQGTPRKQKINNVYVLFLTFFHTKKVARVGWGGFGGGRPLFNCSMFLKI